MQNAQQPQAAITTDRKMILCDLSNDVQRDEEGRGFNEQFQGGQ